jgi:transposase
MLVELSVVEQRYHAVMEVVSGGVSVVEVAKRYGVSRKRCTPGCTATAKVTGQVPVLGVAA